MTPGEAVARKQRGILDDTGHADVSVEESQRPDFTSRFDSNGVAWPENFSYYSASGEWRMLVDWHPPVLAPSPEQYADAERLLRSRCDRFDPLAATLRCWIADTKPLAVKAGWNDDEYTTITDRLILADLASSAPRPSLWTRTPEWAFGVAALVLLVLLALPLVLS